MLSILFFPLLALGAADWASGMRERFAAIDAGSEGTLGVYLKSLSDGQEVDYQASRPWYLSSTTKVPIAVFLLRQVEAGKFSLDQELVVKESDFVDGAGDVQRLPPGTKLSVRHLLQRMLVQSDSSATDMLVRLLGQDELNGFLQQHEGFSRFTTILQVRYDAYGELHPRAATLRNLDYLALKRVKGHQARRAAFARKIGVAPEKLHAPTLEAAFERYYRRGLNSGSLNGYGEFLERLARGELLSAEHTALVLSHMRAITTGERRIKAGLPSGVVFAQKTGTQIGRICNMGILDFGEKRMVIAACVERFRNQAAAEKALQQVGGTVGRAEAEKSLAPSGLSLVGM